MTSNYKLLIDVAGPNKTDEICAGMMSFMLERRHGKFEDFVQYIIQKKKLHKFASMLSFGKSAERPIMIYSAHSMRFNFFLLLQFKFILRVKNPRIRK